MRRSTTFRALGNKRNYFAPSKDLLNAMYINLHEYGVGGFSGYYWSSSEINSNYANGLSFNNGSDISDLKDTEHKVRACCSFMAEEGVYSLRDEGRTGGLICYISGTIYYEAAPSDQSAGKAWSNVTELLIGTTGTVIGTGQANTLAIIEQAGHIDSVAKLCNDLIL